MEKTLIVSPEGKDSLILEKLLRMDGYNDITVVCSAGEARRKFNSGNYRIVVINMPLGDESGRSLAFQFAEADAGVLAIVKSGNEEIFGRYGIEKGVYIQTKPLNRQMFHNAICFINSAQNKILSLKAKNAKLLKTLEELKVVNKAKCVLIEKKGMSEEDAHHFIEKQAMDMRLTKVQVAENILSSS